MNGHNAGGPPQRTGRRILVVDSDPSVAQMLCALLTEHGHITHAVTHSLRVFDAAQAFAPDLILMELLLPYLDGIDQMKLLSLEDRTARVPVIMMAASRRALDGIEDPALAPIFAHICKPIDEAELLSTIAAAPLPAL